MRGRNEAHVDAHALVAADRTYYVLLNGAQQLGLRGRRKFAYFVKKHRAALRFFQKAAPRAHRAGEAPLHMTEKLALQQRFRQGRAVRW